MDSEKMGISKIFLKGHQYHCHRTGILRNFAEKLYYEKLLYSQRLYFYTTILSLRFYSSENVNPFN